MYKPALESYQTTADLQHDPVMMEILVVEASP
jgi:hypothetical protein